MVCVMTDELYHHGIKGQKWGIRRYQNPDGSYTEAGKKRYLNPDGSLNYRGIQKQRKDAIDKDPYGKTKKEGGPGRSKDQSQRLARDNALYGQKGVTRIKDKMSTGQTYSKAKRAESIRAGAKTAAIVLAYGVTMDYLLTGGTATKAVARGIAAEGKYALQYGEFTAKKLMNNMAGIVIGDLGIGRQKFDDYAMRQVFGNNWFLYFMAHYSMLTKVPIVGTVFELQTKPMFSTMGLMDGEYDDALRSIEEYQKQHPNEQITRQLIKWLIKENKIK